jgi:pSer/pThr/pTyr-binding forkhead associated (FHA) protein
MRLTFPNGEHGAVELKDGITTIGSGPGNNLTILAPSVLANHCQIEISEGVAKIKPTHPTHVVTINNLRVASAVEFKAGDLLAFGEVKARAVAVDKAPAAAGPVAPVTFNRDSQEEDGRTKVRQALPKFMLRGVSGITFGKVFPIHGTTVIGRQEGCGIQISSDEISRRHAELRPTPDGVMVEDLGSANGTWVNDRRVTREMLKHGDELRFDTIRFQLVAPGREHAQAQAQAQAPAPAPIAAPTAPRSGVPGFVWAVVAVAVLAVVALVLKLMNVF